MPEERRVREPAWRRVAACRSSFLSALRRLGGLIKGMEERHWLLAFSLCVNVLFVILMILAVTIDSPFDDESAGQGRILVRPTIVHRPQGPLYFGQPAANSELAEIDEHVIYVAGEEAIWAKFTFTDESLERLTEITVYNKCGRPWVIFDLEDNTMIYERYTDGCKPKISLKDEDRDGIPDSMIDWDSKIRYEVDQELTWRPASRRDDP